MKNNESLQSAGEAMTGASAGLIGSGVTLATESTTVASALSAASGMSAVVAETVVAASVTILVGVGTVSGAVGALALPGASTYGVCQLAKGVQSPQEAG